MRMNSFLPLLMSITAFLYVAGQCHITFGEDAPCPDADIYQLTEQFHGDCVPVRQQTNTNIKWHLFRQYQLVKKHDSEYSSSSLRARK